MMCAGCFFFLYPYLTRKPKKEISFFSIYSAIPLYYTFFLINRHQGADVVENFLPKQSCLRFLNASKRHLNTFKLLLTFTKNFEGPLAFMYGYLNLNMSSQSRNSIFLTRLFQEKFSTTSDPRF